jgi:AraC-like DNA-binding protein
MAVNGSKTVLGQRQQMTTPQAWENELEREKTAILLAADLVLDSFLDAVLRAIVLTLKVTSVGIWLYDETLETTILYVDYEDNQLRRGEAISRPGAAANHILRQWDAEYMPLLKQKQILLQDVRQSTPKLPEYSQTRRYNQRRGIKTIMVVPLLSEDTFLGNITLRSNRQRNYQPEEIELVRWFACHICAAIQQIRSQGSALKPEAIVNPSILPDLSESKSEYRLWQAVAYIEDHLDQSLSLTQLAAVVQISPDYFSHWFKQSLGVSPHQYIIKCRLQRAKQLIIQGELTIAEVARKVGFANQAHLNRHFKRVFGMTPKEIRRKQPEHTKK